MEKLLEYDGNNSFSTNNESTYINDYIKYYKFDLSTEVNNLNEVKSSSEKDDYYNMDEEDFNSYDKYDFSVYSNCLKYRPKISYGCACCDNKKKVNGCVSDINYAKEKLMKFLNSKKQTQIKVDISIYLYIKDLFKSIKIKLKLVDRPIFLNTKKTRVEENTKSFLMDLRRNDGEYIIIFPGVDTKIEILDVNKEFRQILMKINEPERDIVVINRVKDPTTLKYIDKSSNVNINPEERIFLIGLDEGHLFIAGIKHNVYTVKQAHESLKPHNLKYKKKGYYKRQGEWFFVPVNHNLSITDENLITSKSYRIGTGRPHIISHSISLLGVDYVKGKVTHPDHKTIELSEWHRIYSNNEHRYEIKGLTWID